MVNITASIRNMTQLMLFKSTRFAKNHKKKLIFALLLLVLGYIAKKKLTLAHLIQFVQLFSKVIDLIPLPQAPKLRQLAEYSHSESLPPRAIYECMNVKEFQRRIESRQNCFEQLKYEHMTGAVVTLVLYNVNAFYFLIQNKYFSDFSQLNASTEFEQIMYDIRKRFTEEMGTLFKKVKELIYHDLTKVELKRICNVDQIIAIFQGMVHQIFTAKFDITQEQSHTFINRVSKQAKNRFTSEYEYTVQSKSTLSKIGGSIFRTIGSVISYGDWFPAPKIQISNQRLQFVKYAYILPLKKARSQAESKMQQSSKWPNQQSKELFRLVTEEIQFALQSLNFSILLRAHAKYNLKILRNRIKKLMIVKNKAEISIVVLMAALHKILNQQFFKSNQLQLRDAYHNSQVKKSIKLTSLENPLQVLNERQMLLGQQKQEISQQEHTLEQVYLKNSFQYLEKEFELKLFNERSGLVMRPKKTEAHEGDEMQKLLSMMGASEALNHQD